jgi:hypothetical protein
MPVLAGPTAWPGLVARNNHDPVSHIRQVDVGVFLLLAVMAAMGTFAVVQIGQVDVLSDELRSRWLPASQSLGEIHAYLSQYRIKQGDLIDARASAPKTRARNAQAVIDGLLDDYAKHADARSRRPHSTSCARAGPLIPREHQARPACPQQRSQCPPTFQGRLSISSTAWKTTFLP